MESREEKTYYIDTNIFLNSVLYDPEKNQEAKVAKAFLEKITSGEIKAVTSLLTWDEFSWIVKKTLGREDALKEGQKFLNFPNLLFKKVTYDTVQHAQDLLRKYNIRPRDALHVVTAIDSGITDIVSIDGDLDIIKEIKRVDLLNLDNEEV